MTHRAAFRSALTLPVLVGALGYFVDIFDLLLFPIIKTPSLSALGVAAGQQLEVGARLLNWQMNGLLLGGILWGVLGDKRGRRSVLFGSIALYSLANIGNAFVHSVEAYSACRFLAGLGLAGELGAAITLVSEALPKEARGYGSSIVAGVGICGAVVAGALGKIFTLHWPGHGWSYAFLTGGALGLLLLGLRMGLAESHLFEEVRQQTVSKGNFLLLFTSRDRFFRFMRCILAGMPVWFVVGILVVNAESFAPALGVRGMVENGMAVAWGYAGGAVGDLLAGAVSQAFRSRRKAIAAYLSMATAGIIVFLLQRGLTAMEFYLLCAALGFSFGYWALLVTVASEQFGTNLRATVTTTVPNFIRGSLTPMAFAFLAFKRHLGMLPAAAVVGAAVLLLAGLSVARMEESFGRDLDFLEEA
ncbi:MAG TPA: MFS transporter [Holophagaceae bacterium]|jgi:putative MFS transporter|nr:MFS transporter [Holophagaceae bacterium]